MSFLDTVSAKLNQGQAAASRTTQTLKLKGQLADVNKRRQDYAAQLGASLYEATKDDPAFRAGREQLYDGITALDQQRSQILQQMQEIEQQAYAAAEAAATFQCQVCGTTVRNTDLFCSGCGTPVDQARPVIPEQNYAQPQTDHPMADTVVLTAGTVVVASDSATPGDKEPIFIEVDSVVAAPQQEAASSVSKPAEPAEAGPADTESAGAEQPKNDGGEGGGGVAGKMLCPRCGNAVAEGDAFCMNCGQSLS